VLRQRNEALKKASAVTDISAWTDLLVEHANSIWRHRENLVSFWNDQINDMYYGLSGEKREFSVSMVFGVRDRERLLEEINQSFRLERRYGYTLYGPHRDDLVVLTKNKKVTTVLSGGQMKSLVIALKILSHRYMKQVSKEEPLLLLDDVFSELDENRQVTLIENLPATQTIVTCTSLPASLRHRKGVYFLDLRSIIQDKSRRGAGVEPQVEDERGPRGGVAEKYQVKSAAVAV
jgi:DNA replication and repair protein RecF